MNNVIELDRWRPHAATPMECPTCGNRWVAVHLPETANLECPGCGFRTANPLHVPMGGAEVPR